MRRAALKPFIGKLVRVVWRDPVGDTSWSRKPLALTTAETETVGWFMGFNARKEAVLAGSRNQDSDSREWGDRNAIPISVIEAVHALTE